MGVIGRSKSPWLLDFSRLFDGDTSISRLSAFRPFSGERVTTVARRFREGVSGTAIVALGPVDPPSVCMGAGDSQNERDCSAENRLGCSEGMVGSVCSAKFIVFRMDGLGRGDMDAALRSIENAVEWR